MIGSFLFGFGTALGVAGVISYYKYRTFVDNEHLKKKISEEIVILEDAEQLSVRVKSIISSDFNSINSFILLFDDEIGDYVFMNPEDNSKNIKKFDDFRDFFVYLEGQDRLIRKKDILNLKNNVGKQGESFIKELNINILLPLVFEKRLIGIICIGKKKSNRSYSLNQIELIESIRRDITVAFTNALLFERMSKLFEEVENQNIQLKELDRAKSVFISNVSHELRTPLVSVKGYIEYILSGKFGELTVKQKEGLDISLKNIKRFENLINSLLLFAQIQAGKIKMHYEDIDFVKLIKDSVDEIKILADKKNISLLSEVPHDALCRIDGQKMKQVIINLVSNAIKFTDKGFVKVSLEKKGGFAMITVKDTGIGIPDDQIKHIFDRFVQVDGNLDRKYGGTGIGLSIVKSILDMHNISIHVDSKMVIGTSFSFKVPLI